MRLETFDHINFDFFFMKKLYYFNKQYIHHWRCFDMPFPIKQFGLLTALFVRMIEEN